MLIEKFVSPRINKDISGLEIFNTVKKFQYASRGRWAVYHCLLSLGIKGNILVPTYVCDSILIPIKLLGLKPIFYDHRCEDLNPDIDSIKVLINEYEVSACVVVSLYGLAADLINIEALLNQHNVMMIDDAAQSFGAKINGKMVGTFGDAGFMSFSPGKPTVAHMGAYFWTKNEIYSIDYTHHKALHWLVYIDFYFNRLYTYRFKKYQLFKLLSLIRVFFKFIDIKNDRIEKFEKPILGGVVNDTFEVNFEYRNFWFFEIQKLFISSNQEAYRMIQPLQGSISPHKIVIIAKDKYCADMLITFMKKSSIYAQKGYRLLTSDTECLPNIRKMNMCIVELPIDPTISKMEYLKTKLNDFLEEYRAYCN